MSKVPYKHCLYDGVPIPDFITPERMLEVKEKHKTRVDDVFIATYQKSGTTWLQHILNQLYDQPQGDVPTINEAVPWLEEFSQAHVDAMKSPRILKTHDQWSWIPKGEGVRFIFCYRNPKDVVCSYYNHMANVFIGHYEYTGTLDQFYRDIFSKPGVSENGDYFNHLSGWLEQRHRDDILFLTYEAMVEDLEREIKRIIGFLGLDCSADKISRITNSSMFSSMAVNPYVNYNWRDGTVKVAGSKFIRKGKVGSWKEELNEEHSRELDVEWERKIGDVFGIKMRDSL